MWHQRTESLLWSRKENKRWYKCLEFSIHLFGLKVLLKVPPPRKFSQPSGGARPVAIQMKPAAKNQGPSNQPSASPEPFRPPRPCPHPHQCQGGKTSQKYSEPIFGEGAEESHSTKHPSQVVFWQSTLCGFKTTRAAQLVNLIYIDNLATCKLIDLDCCERINKSPHRHWER